MKKNIIRDEALPALPSDGKKLAGNTWMAELVKGQDDSVSRILYWGSGSAPCWRVQAMLSEKKLEYDSKLLSFSDGMISAFLFSTA